MMKLQGKIFVSDKITDTLCTGTPKDTFLKCPK